MKRRAIFVSAALFLMFFTPAVAWNLSWLGEAIQEQNSAEPYSFQQTYQKSLPVFSLEYLSKNKAGAKNTSQSEIDVAALLKPQKKAKAISTVPFVFSANLTSIAGYSSDEITEISAWSSYLNGVPKNSSPDKWDYQKDNQLNAKKEPGNLIVREEVARLKEVYSGEPRISNVCSIFRYYRYGDNASKGWRYINDPRGSNWAYANESIKIGRNAGYAAAGDCDDFAIVMSALVESIGCSSRIVLAANNTGGKSHAFAEVYLGKDCGTDSKVERIIKWMLIKFKTDKIYAHVDTDTKNIWLNLDWWADHPGGPFFKADEYVIYSDGDENNLAPLSG